MSSLLLVSQHAPPSGIIAARRIGGLVKYLARDGHRLTVLTSRISGEGAIEGAERVVRTRDLFASQLNWRRRSFPAMSGLGPATYSRASRLESLARARPGRGGLAALRASGRVAPGAEGAVRLRAHELAAAVCRT